MVWNLKAQALKYCQQDLLLFIKLLINLVPNFLKCSEWIY